MIVKGRGYQHPPRPSQVRLVVHETAAGARRVEGMPDDAGYLVTEEWRGAGTVVKTLAFYPDRTAALDVLSARAQELEGQLYRPVAPAPRSRGAPHRPLLRARTGHRGRTLHRAAAYGGFQLPGFDANVSVVMAERPAVFTAAPWAHRILVPAVVHAMGLRTVVRGFRLLSFASIVAAGGLLFLFL